MLPSTSRAHGFWEPPAPEFWAEQPPSRSAPQPVFGGRVPEPKERVSTSLGGLSIALRSLLRQRRRMFLSIIAVALGVGYLAGSLSLLQRVGTGLADQAGSGAELADLVVEGAIADDGPLQQVRRLVPDSLVAEIAEVPGVAAVEARVESASALIIGTGGTPVVGLGPTERPLGANFPLDAAMNPYEFVGDGRAPRTATDVVLDEASAKAAGAKVGDEVRIATSSGISPYLVTGIVRMADGEFPASSSLALFDIDTARTLFSAETDNTAIGIRVEADASVDEVRDAIQRLLQPTAEVSTAAQYTEHRQATLGKSFTMVKALLVGFAALALIVGSFTVANSMALLFEHRRRGFATLRLVGASPRQLLAAATIEAALGGMIAGVIGLGLGVGVGWAIERLIQSMGTSLPVSGAVITWWIPLVALGVGALVTTASALSPARMAARTPPVQAVTGIDDRTNGRSRGAVLVRWAVLLIVLGGGAGLAGLTLGGAEIAPIAAGAGVAVAIVLVLLPRVLSGIVGLVTSLLLGSSVALKRMSTLRSRQARTRAASTTAALLLSAAVVTGLSVLSSSFVMSIEGQVTSSIRSDLVIDSATFTRGGLPADVIPRLKEQPGVEAVSGWRIGAAQFASSLLWRAAGVDGSTALSMIDLDIEGRAPTTFGRDEVLVSRELASRELLTAGDQVEMRFQNGSSQPVTIKGIFESQLRILLGDIVMDSTLLEQNLPTSIDVVAFVNLTADAPASTRAELTTLADEYGAKVLAPAELVSSRAELLRGFGRVIQWMLAFSVVLALIGVANTLQLGVNERRRELGLLRAVGATRRQVLRLVMAEAGALSLVGTVVGMGVGLGAAYATVHALSDYGLNQFVAPAWTLVVVAVVAIGLGLVGAIVPAMRAADLPMLEAISESGPKESARRRRAVAATTEPRPVVGPVGPMAQPVPQPMAPPTLASAPMAPPPVVLAATPPPPPAPTIVPPTIAPPIIAPPPIVPPPIPVVAPTPIAVTIEAESPTEPAFASADADEGPGILEPTTVRDVFRAHSPTRPPEINMALRCYNCGYEPGEGELCLACGAAQTPAPVGMFTLRNTADEPPATVTVPTVSNTTYASGPSAVGGVDWSIAGREAVAAEIVEDLPTPTPPPPGPVPPSAPAGGAPTWQSLGSIFDGRPDPAADAAARSPFGQFSAEPPSMPNEGAAFSDPPAAAYIPPSASPMFSATASTNGNPPSNGSRNGNGNSTPNGHGATNGDSAGHVPNPPNPPVADGPVLSDRHGLSSAITRLGASSRANGATAFSIAGALLAPDERVHSVVAGTSLGMPTVVVVAGQRVLVVSERHYVPDIEIFRVGAPLVVHGRHANEQASLTFADGERLITVDQIHDVACAVELTGFINDRSRQPVT